MSKSSSTGTKRYQQTSQPWQSWDTTTRYLVLRMGQALLNAAMLFLLANLYHFVGRRLLGADGMPGWIGRPDSLEATVM